MAKGYWITWYHTEVDPVAHAKYAALSGSAIAAFGGRFLARGIPAATYEGGAQYRCVVVEFKSVTDAIAAYESPAYREALSALDSATEREVRILEGQ